MKDLLLYVNPLAVAALFIYQHYRLKFLQQAINDQRSLITETKDVVTQQAAAISSQATVVDTAIKYSQAFEPAKIEEIVRRELKLEFAEDRSALERQLEDLRGQQHTVAARAIEVATQKAREHLSNLFTPIVVEYITYLHTLSDEAREKAIAEIGGEEAKEMVRVIYQRTRERLVGLLTSPPSENPGG